MSSRKAEFSPSDWQYIVSVAGDEREPLTRREYEELLARAQLKFEDVNPRDRHYFHSNPLPDEQLASSRGCHVTCGAGSYGIDGRIKATINHRRALGIQQEMVAVWPPSELVKMLRGTGLIPELHDGLVSIVDGNTHWVLHGITPAQWIVEAKYVLDRLGIGCDCAIRSRRTGWGARGVRYDEQCARCRRITEVDNYTDLCRRCSD